MKVRDKLKEVSSVLYSRLIVLEKSARQLLEYSQGGPNIFLTPHGLSHVSAVERNYDWILRDEDLSLFCPSELFCLLCATLLHDAFMIPQDASDVESARKNHAARAKDILVKHPDQFHLEMNEAVIIGDVIWGHSLYDFSEIDEDKALGPDLIYLRKLAACLSIADLCHVDSSRAPQIVFKYLNFDNESAYHWKKHFQVSGVTRKKHDIVITANVFTDDGEKELEEFEGLLKNQLNIVKPYFSSELTPFSGVDLRMSRLNSPLDVPLKFNANVSSILDLLIGGVYQRDDVFIRELVQNALDACTLRAAASQKRQEPYAPEILITFLNAGNKVKAIRIDDNGIGMDVYDIQDTVLWIGTTISKKESVQKLLRETTGRQLIATFGIGLLSCFKVAKSISIRTKKETGPSLKVDLTNISDEIKSEEYSDNMIGTTIIVELKDEVVGKISRESIQYYFRMINYVNVGEMVLDWAEETKEIDRGRMFKAAKSEAKAVGVEKYSEIKSDVSVTIKGDDYSGKFYLNLSEIASVIKSRGNMDILSEGIFVTKESTRNWLPEVFENFDGILNFSARAIDLPISRDRVVNNEKFEQKKGELRGKIERVIEKLVDRTNIEEDEGGEKAGILTTYLYIKADSNWKAKILSRLDKYSVCQFGVRGKETLAKIRKKGKEKIYIRYSEGRYVTEIGRLDGCTIFHKADDLTTLQAALKRQEGETVIDGRRQDEAEMTLIEADMLKEYFYAHQVEAVDLKTTNVIEGTYKSCVIPESVRKKIPKEYKFVMIEGIRNKKAWRVGKEVWINIANPKMKKVYDQLNRDGGTEEEKVRLAIILFGLLGMKMEECSEKIIKWIK
jgi:Histidine kinase-, DNA gyrase B-, and HSP90-like ATPase